MSGLFGGLTAGRASGTPERIGFGAGVVALGEIAGDRGGVALGGREMPLAAFIATIAIRITEGYLSELLGAYWILALGGLLMLSVVLLPRGLIATPILWLGARRFGRGRP